MKILTVIGTRPEAVKLAPVVARLAQEPNADSYVLSTGQHREMLDQVLGLFEIVPRFDLRVMRPGQSPTDVMASVLSEMQPILRDLAPDWVLVQGDTTSVLAAALAASYAGCSIGHVEAGLRSYDRRNPFPEEINRVLVDHISDACFAPTERARQALEKEGISPSAIHVTGNTVIDALQTMVKRLPGAIGSKELDTRKQILVTAHRRESHGQPIRRICAALQQLASRSDVQVIYPVHRSPDIWEPVHQMLAGVANIALLGPVDYLTFVDLMARSYVILTDSGGVQEEAPSLGVPVMVMRSVTERPEAVDAGVARLVGTETELIVSEVARLLDQPEERSAMARAVNPFGDGKAAQRIVDILLQRSIT